jgi:superfamily II DNA or RNA helicase
MLADALMQMSKTDTEFSVQQVDANNRSVESLNALRAITAPLTINAGSELQIATQQLAPTEFHALRTLGAFPNPEFTRRERLRLSTYRIPRYISLEHHTRATLSLPRGILQTIVDNVPNSQTTDTTTLGHPISARLTRRLSNEQQRAHDAMLAQSSGIMVARPGFGKTIVAASMIASLGVSTLILVQSKTLAEQWRDELGKLLAIETKPYIVEHTNTGRLRKKDVIGRLFGAKDNRSGVIDVATLQTMKNRRDLTTIFADYGLVIADETHSIPALTYDAVFRQITCHYLYGLSATTHRRDGMDNVLKLRFGDIGYRSSKVAASVDQLKRQYTPRCTSFGAHHPALLTAPVEQILNALATNAPRNDAIIEDIQRGLNAGRHILLLTRRTKHVEVLADLLAAKTSAPIFKLSGQQKNHVNKEVCAHARNHTSSSQPSAMQVIASTSHH